MFVGQMLLHIKSVMLYVEMYKFRFIDSVWWQCVFPSRLRFVICRMRHSYESDHSAFPHTAVMWTLKVKLFKCQCGSNS